MCRAVLLRLHWHRGERGVGTLPRHLDFRLLCVLLDAQAPLCPGYATVAVSATGPEPRGSNLRRCCDCSSCSVWSSSKMVEERIPLLPHISGVRVEKMWSFANFFRLVSMYPLALCFPFALVLSERSGMIQERSRNVLGTV